MNRKSKILCTALALTFAAGTAAPVMAAPVLVPSTPVASGEVIQVQTRRQERRMERRDRRFERRQDRRERRFERRQDRREARFERRNGVPYYNGRRGYTYYRSGYREYNGFWFPAAAFVAGAIIGGSVGGGSTVVVPGGNAHVQWCYDRYRSYRASDNTFQPYDGPRRQCYSPYS